MSNSLRKQLYKATSIPRNNSDVRALRVERDLKRRSEHREQVIFGKRFRRRPSFAELEEIVTQADITRLDERLLSKDIGQRMNALKILNRALTETSELVENYIMNGNCLDILRTSLSSKNEEEKVLALWCISNIAAGSLELCRKLLDFVPLLVLILRDENLTLKEHAAFALGNMATEGDEIRKVLYANNVVQLLVDLIKIPDVELSTIETVCFGLSTIARTGEVQEIVDSDVIEVLIRLLARDYLSENGIVELLWLCAYLAQNDVYIDLFFKEGLNFAKILVDKLQQFSADSIVIMPLLRLLGNITSSKNSKYLDEMIDSSPDFMKNLLALTHIDNRAIKKEVLWVVSEIARGSEYEVRILVESDTITCLCNLMKKGNYDIRKEASIALLNLASNGRKFYDLIPMMELLPSLIEFLSAHDYETNFLGLQFVKMFADYTKNAREILIEEFVTDAIELCTLSEEESIRLAAKKLLESIYGSANATPRLGSRNSSPKRS